MNKLCDLIRVDMKPAFGVTEPGAIAFAAAYARSLTSGEISAITLDLNSGIYKNAFTCGIPNSEELGNAWSAALGAVGGDHTLLLEALRPITPEDNERARALIEGGRVTVRLDGISSSILIRVRVEAESGYGEVTCRGGHTNVVRVVQNGTVLVEKQENGQSGGGDPCAAICERTVHELIEYAKTAPLSDLAFLREAAEMNLALFEQGRAEGKTPITEQLILQNGGEVFSCDAHRSARVIACGAIEARTNAVARPAMSITGSGSHGILATLPLYACCTVDSCSEEQLLRALAMSLLMTIYVKEYSGRLSALCGCALAAGVGTACGIVYLHGGDAQAYVRAINNIASSLTGMICHGGNPGCTLKALTGVDAAFSAAELALAGVSVDEIHGILGASPERTIQNMGLVSSPGMSETEGTIVGIMREHKE